MRLKPMDVPVQAEAGHWLEVLTGLGQWLRLVIGDHQVLVAVGFAALGWSDHG